jgi:hypothetical protein
MRVKIGPYKNWVGPYQIVDKIFFWHEKFPSEELEARWDYKLHEKLADWLSDTWVNGFCNWINERNQRKIYIRIDRFDTWSMDHTLALIIVPMLKQLRDTKHGSPCTDVEDVPEHLRPDPNRIKLSEEGKIKYWDIDNTVHERWDWILNEMIYAFEAEADDDYESKFRSGEHDIYWEKKENGLSEMKTGPNDTYQFDREAFDKDYERRKNGLRLFAKYYLGLWD